MTTSTTSSRSYGAAGTRPRQTTIEYPDITLIGKAGAGKTTAAEFLERSFGYRRMSFAGLLKDISAQIWGDEARTDRDKLQRLGVAVREIDADAWLNALLYTRSGATQPVVVDDCRFPNEYWRLREEGFIAVRIEAPVDTRVNRLQSIGKFQDHAQLEHVSEVALDDVAADHTITNSADLDVLHHGLLGVIEKELKRS